MTYKFLNEISRVNEMYSRHRQLSGEDFNIFSIMSMDSDEVFTHSALLAELLNPKGTHGLGKMPLELFIKSFLDPDYLMNLDNAFCKKEVHLGFTNEDKTEGGRVDILVKDLQGNVIIIENKIYAAEQLNQLARYKKQYPHAELFYLTLYGKESAQNIDHSEEKIYRNLSYKDHVIPWISSCTEMAYNKPMLREVLNQYIFLLKKLTNQTTNDDMADQITQIITENFEASLEIYRNFEKASHKLKKDLLYDLSQILQKNYPTLNVSTTEHKAFPAVRIEGFVNNVTLYFWLKSNKLPVLSVQGDSLETLGSKLSGFQSSDLEGKIISYWKLLPVLNEEELFKDQKETLLNRFQTNIKSDVAALMN